MPLIHVRTEVTIKADCIAAYEQVVREALAGAVQFGPDAVAVRLFQDSKDSGSFLICETWEAPSVEVIQTAMAQSPGYQAYLDKTRPMEAKPTVVRFPMTITEHGSARLALGKSAGDGGGGDDKPMLWVALADTIIVEDNEAFEKAARILLAELAALPECEYIHLAHDLAEPSRWFWTERWSATEAWWTGPLFETACMKRYLEVVKAYLVEPPVVRTDLRLLWSYDRNAA